MEQTPFDHAPPASLPPVKKETNHRAILVGGGLLLVVALGTSGFFWMQKRAEENRLMALRGQLKAIVLADNALALEVLELDESSHITYAEFFKRTDKNKENRADLVRQVRAIEAGPYQASVTNFVKLMEFESEFVRAEEDLSRQNIEVSTRRDALDSALNAGQDASTNFKKANDEYMAAPYGEDYGEKMSADLARSRADAAQTEAKTTLTQYQESNAKLRTTLGAAELAVGDWIRSEHSLYPYAFAPPRDVMNLLSKRKSKYSLALSGTEGTNKPLSTTPLIKTSAPIGAAPVATATPKPAVPKRLRSTSPFEGERFPETRIREITPEEAANYDEDSLRYAINEMYARYGMTFKDKDYQSNFTSYKWYRPEDRWTPSQIEREFTANEKSNMKILVAERDARRSSEQ